MEYEAKNYALLIQIYKEFSFYFAKGCTSSTLDLAAILKAYKPHSDIAVDEVANAICWCIKSLQALEVRRPVRCLEEVLSFAASVLEQQNREE